MATCQNELVSGNKRINEVVEKMKGVADKFLEDLPTSQMDDKTLHNLYKGMLGTIEGAQQTLSKHRLDNGIKIERPKANNLDATKMIVDANIVPGIKNAQARIDAIQDSFKGLKSLEGLNISKAYKTSMTDIMNDSLESVNPIASSTWQERGGTAKDFSDVLVLLSHQERLDITVQMADRFPREFDKIKNSLVEHDAPRVSAERAMQLLEDLETIEFEMNGALDLASLYARNPFEDAMEVSPSFLRSTEAYTDSVQASVISKQFIDDKLQRVIKNQAGRLTESITSKLMKSNVPGAQFFTLNILENPSGVGGEFVRGSTAAIVADMKHKRSIYAVNKAYSDLLDSEGSLRGWSRAKRLIMQNGHARTHPELAEINQTVMLYLNAKRLNKQIDASPHITKYAEIQTAEYHKIHDDGVGKVAGITDKNKLRYYDQQVYDDHKIMQLAKGSHNIDQLGDLFGEGLHRGGMPREIAYSAGAALMRVKLNTANRGGLKASTRIGEDEIVGMLPKLTELVEQMKADGIGATEIKQFVDLVNAGLEDSTPGYAKSRYNFDISASKVIDGQNVRILDLLEQDSPGRFDSYSKEANGRIAIAEAMPELNSDDAFNTYLFDVGKQAQLMGTSVDTRAMRNSLNLIMGRTPIGALPTDVRKIRDLVALAGMGGLGESQLAETGMAVNRGIAGLIGTAQMLSGRKGKRLASRGIELTPEQASNAKFMGELESLTGLYQDMHLVVRRNIHYDQKDSDYGVLSKLVNTATGGKYRNSLKGAQDKFTGYGAIRSMQDQLSMAGLMQDINRAFKGDKAFTSIKRFKDLGVDIENTDNVFFRNIRDYAELDNNGNIAALNIHRWSPMDRDAAGVVLNRHAAQVVQRGFVGEMSPLMANPWVAFMMQFRSYPILAAEKQQARHLKFADKEAATGIFLNTVSSAGARIIRYSSVSAAQPLGDREDYMKRQMENLAWDTFSYMGVAGMTPQLSTYANQLMGNPFGVGQNGRAVEGLHTEVPALSYVSKLVAAHDSVTNGEPLTDVDMARMQSIFSLGTIAYLNIFAGIFRTGLNQ